MIPNYEVPTAWKGHENFLHWLFVIKQPNIFVEVGVYHGFSYFCACQIVKGHNLGTLCIGVDTWEGDIHTVYNTEDHPDTIYETVRRYNETNYKDFSQLRRQPSIVASASVNDRSVDILHIDAGHTYEAIKSDFTSRTGLWVFFSTFPFIIAF